MNAAEHLELFLGPMAMGWSAPANSLGLQVCLFENQPQAGLMTLTTLGLSHHLVRMGDGRAVRQEFVIVAPKDAEREGLAKLLLFLAESTVKSHRAVLRGEVIDLGDRIVAGSRASALYACMPVLFPDEFATLRDTVPPTVFVWFFPVVSEEVHFIAAEGWNRFEENLEAKDPDLFDLNRESSV